MMRLRNFALAALTLLLVAGAVSFFVIRSGWLREKIRTTAIAELEKATGAGVEMKGFDFDYTTGVARLEGLVLHGLEPTSEQPLFAARSVEAGLKIISVFARKVDLKKLVVQSPVLNLIVNADGTTNIPKPPGARAGGKNALEGITDLAADVFEIKAGTVHYAQESIPLDIRGENLNLRLDFETAVRRYKGAIASNRVSIKAGKIDTVALNFASAITIDDKKIGFSNARVSMQHSAATLNGVIAPFPSVEGQFDIAGKVFLAEVLSLAHSRAADGWVNARGKLHFRGSDYTFLGTASGAGLTLRAGGAAFRGITIESSLDVSPTRIKAATLSAFAPEGEFKGSAELRGLNRFALDGKIADVSLEALNADAAKGKLAWSGLVSGPVHASGLLLGGQVQDAKANAQLSIVPSAGATPLEGYINFNYVQRANAIQLTDTYFSTPASKLTLSGTLSEALRVTFASRDLKDLLPALTLAEVQLPDGLPIELKDGEAKFDGIVTGDLKSPHIAGKVSLSNFVYDERQYGSLTLDADASPYFLKATHIVIAENGLQASGSATIPLKEWKLDEHGALSAAVSMRGVPVSQLLQQFESDLEAEGLMSGTATIIGTPADPAIQAKVTIDKFSLANEKLDRVQVDMHYTDGVANIISGQASAGESRLMFKGSYDRKGIVKFDATGTALTLSRWKAVRDLPRVIDGSGELRAIGSGVLEGKQFQLRTLDARMAVSGFSLDGKKLGTLDLVAVTGGSTLSLQADASVSGAKAKLKGEWRLEGDYPGSGQLDFTPISFATLQDLRPPDANQERWPLSGLIAASASFNGPALNPAKWKGQITVATVEARPQRRARESNLSTQDLVLRNAKPIRLDIDGNSITVRSGQLIAKDTSIDVSGTFSFFDRSPWDLKLKGAMNLAIAKNFDSGILATGVATMDASVRGELRDPQLFGRLELKNASLFLEDIPNGLDKVNGTVLFINKRATIENKLTAESGGGTISLTGFVESAGDELRYRLLATANRVRLRYPEGVSTVADFSLGLTGTSARSLLSGSISIVRSGFTPRTDIGTILAQSGKESSPHPSANEFLNNMQFDVRVQTAPNVELLTSLTRDVQANADLRVRGSAVRPLVQGRVTINQGEINFFGNKYTINRGQVAFFNSTDPVIDMDLETRVRGVEVTITFAGALKKLNVSYRSDPPLQSQEIIALLTVGRSPDANQAIATAPAGQNQGGFLETTGNSLLGQAISAPVNSRLQRLFGVSRVKIDPQLTGFEGTPQARLTLEQQVSKDITVTFVTNLNKTQQQIVRVEWDFNRNWSAVAVRDENGIFGLDFLYKRRFK